MNLEAYVESQRGFCVDVFNALTTTDTKEKNIMFSPYSLSNVLFMLQVGARGSTAKQIKTCLKVVDCNDYHLKNRSLQMALTPKEGEKKYALRTFNTIFADGQYKIENDYMDLIEAFYGGGFYSVDFMNNAVSVCTEINKWVSRNTDGLITDLISNLDSMVKLVIVNAIYFKGKWETTFNPLYPTLQPFRTSDGLVKKVDMMFQSTHLRYYRDTDCQILQIPYEYGASMYIILPSSSQNDTTMMQILMTADRLAKWNQIFAKAYRSLINLWLPKLKIDYTFPLKEIMMKLNMTDMFDARKANLSGLAVHLHVTDGIQKVVLDIDEEGTVAAAASAMSCGLLCSRPQPIDFKVDRPFLFMIRDDATGLDLFLGSVTDPDTK
uniref:Leukocyte elastase inhibitor-like n=1 Tax=Saccoglossus kowalevskii TaxID=10224 RepID=A0ABM0GSX9_SACKO|nr:PREDICTED: leukocyte elastase inhibitor-like [Saccoglossus kowalevskii]